MPIGLDYPGVEAAARMLGVTLDAEQFSKIQLLEGEWMTAIREKHRKD